MCWDGCGWTPQQPSCFSSIAKADACWDQSQALYNLVSKVVMDIFQTNPGIIPTPPPGVGSGHILGVTDGSNAAPGQVGEFIQSTTAVNYPAGVLTQLVISSLVVPPGDWDIYGACFYSVPVGFFGFNLSPEPAGISNDIRGQVGASVVDLGGVIASMARGSFSVPTLLAFSVTVDQRTAGLLSGVAYLTINARRRR